MGHPVFAYIPPNGELRGGAWVVIDPTINEEMMEMYVDSNARGGILEPPGICDVKFRKREAQLMPLYVQISHEFADLHDRPGRMKAKGVIRDIVPWKRAREYFFWRVRRRLVQDALVQRLKAADENLSHADCLNLIISWSNGAASWEDDKAVLDFFEKQGAVINDKLGEVRAESVKTTVAALLDTLSPEQKSE